MTTSIKHGNIFVEENRVEAVAQHRCNNNQDFLSTICDFTMSSLFLEQMSDF